MGPEVWYLILCDDARSDPANSLRVNITGLLTRIRCREVDGFPFVHPLITVLLMLSKCRGTGELSVRIVHNQTGEIVYRSQTRRLRFAGSPDELMGVVFRVRDCAFPDLGLYYVECIFSGTVLARQRFLIAPNT